MFRDQILFLSFSETFNTYKDRVVESGSDDGKKACKFLRRWLQGCSGLNDENFGFSQGNPCIIIKLNRIVNFRPKVGLPFKFKSCTNVNWHKMPPVNTFNAPR